MARPGPGWFGWLLLAAPLAACASANENAGPTVTSTPPPAPPDSKLVFPFPDFEERFADHSLAVGSGGYGLEFLARAEIGPDGRTDRAFAGVIDGRLIVRNASTGALAAIPVEGGAPSLIAPAVPEGAPIGGDALGIYWADWDGSIRQAPDRRLANVPGSPRYLFVGATDLYVFAHTQGFPHDVGMTLWAVPRSGGAPRAVAELPGRDGVFPERRPVEHAGAFYFTHARDVFRLSRSGALSRIATVGAKQIAITDAGFPYLFEVVLVDADFVYLQGYPYLLRVPVRGGDPIVVTGRIPTTPLGMWALGDSLYLDDEGSVHTAPRAGGTWRLAAWVPGPVRDIFERGGKLHALADRMLVRVDPIVRPDRRLVKTEVSNLMALAARGPNLYYTLSDRTPEIWSVRKKGGEPWLVMRTPWLAAAPVFDADGIYLLDEDGAVLRAPLAGGPTTELGRNPSGGPRSRFDRSDDLLPRLLGVDAGFVYWLDQERGTLMRLARTKTGGAPQAIAQGLRRPIELAVGDGFAAVETVDGRKWTLVHVPLASPGSAQPLATGDDRIPFAAVGRDLRWAVGKQVFGQTAGGAPFAIPLSSYSRGSRVADLAFRGNTLVLAGEGGGVHSEVSGRDAVRILAGGQSGPAMLIVDDDAVYFADLGYTLNHKGTRARAECCSIWAAPR